VRVGQWTVQELRGDGLPEIGGESAAAADGLQQAGGEQAVGGGLDSPL
jgi:hypothetical protein